MIPAVRVAWRAAGLAALCAVAYPLVIGWNLLARVLRFSPARGRMWLFRRWSRAVLALLGARIEARGIPPTPPFFLVSNHLGYVDIAVLAARVDAVFVARGDLARWPVFGFLSRSVGTLYVDRETKRDIPRVAAAMESVLGSGVGVVLFPEGTSSDGRDVLPFRPSLLEPAARLAIPVHWATISYRTPPGQPPAERAVCWWDDMAFVPHLIGLMRLRGFEARVVFGEDPVSDGDRKSLAQSLHAAVRRSKEGASP